MANRNTLAASKLSEFKEWLDLKGIEHRPTEADFQVLQIRLPGEVKWHAIYERLKSKQHLTVTLPLERLLQEFINEKSGKHTQVAPTKHAPNLGPAPWEGT